MTRGSAFEGLGIMGAGEPESYIPGETPLEVRLARDTAVCNSDDRWQRGPLLLTLAAAARHEESGFDHNFFLEAYVAELSHQSPEEREDHIGPFLTEMIQALYDAGSNDFMLAIEGWVPERIAAELAGTPERRLALSYRGTAGSFGCGSQYCSFTLDGSATYAGAGSDYCDYDLGDSEGMVGYASFGCRFHVRSLSQIAFPVCQAFFMYRNHEGMRLPLDCSFHVREMGDLEDKGPIAAIRRRVWEHVVLRKYKNVIVREDEAASPEEVEQ